MPDERATTGANLIGTDGHAATAGVRLAGVRKTFGDVVAVAGIDLSVEEGAFVTLLGPSGCGKTTILRVIAGLERPDAGLVEIRGRRVSDVPIHKRNVGLVFQDYALFPHKTVFDNVAFGLKYRAVGRAQISPLVARALEIVRLAGVEGRYPAQLSGGQQQRVALARAIVIEPDILLLDEPLSALDANLREEMRGELKAIQRALGITTVFVTHDQEEALSLSDTVVVIRSGSIEQTGPPELVYRRPVTRFVAEFLGKANILDGFVAAREEAMPDLVGVELANGLRVYARGRPMGRIGAPAAVVVRAHNVRLDLTGSRSASRTAGMSGETVNRFDGVIVDTNYLGGVAEYLVDVRGTEIRAIAPVGDHLHRRGRPVGVHFAPADCVLLNAEGR